MVWPEWTAAAADLMFGLGFSLGIFVLNFPQHYECWKQRSAEGLSLAYILICTISNVTLWLATVLGDYNVIVAAAMGSNTTAQGVNATLTMNASFVDEMEWNNSLADSSRILLLEEATNAPPLPGQEEELSLILLRVLNTLNACIPSFQNFLCILVGVPSYIFYYFMFSKPQPRIAELIEDESIHRRPASEEPLLSFEDREDGQEDLTLTREPSALSPRSPTRLYYSDGTEHGMAKIFTFLTWFVCFILTLISGAVVLSNDFLLESSLLAIFGSVAAITNTILYIPQIVTLHRNQHEGVLSLSALILSIWGDFSQLIFWVVGPGESGWVLSALVADAGMQLILIGQIIHFRKRRFRQEQLVTQQQQTIYEYVHDSSEMDDSFHCGDMGKGEIQVVFGDILEMYEDTTTTVGRLMETPSRQSMTSMTSTSPESLEFSASDMII